MSVLIAHAGAGSSWQALVTAIGVLSAVLFLLAAAGVVKVKDHNDLVLPLAGVVIISSLGTGQSDFLSDQIGWALPIGVVALAGLVWLGFKPDEFSITAPPTLLLVGVAAIAGVLLQGPLTGAFHPIEFFVPTNFAQLDDLEIDITSPTDQDVISGPFTLQVNIIGGSVSNVEQSEDDAPEDPEEQGILHILLGGANRLEVAPNEGCSIESPCTTLTYDLDLEPGVYTIFADFRTATGGTFGQSVFDRVQIEVR